ncbi:hypothetical protein E2C01_005494 [Portunus trituberculatus]|uniref:Uncharacterized protein n=1 Tax=Portunus trituberculatus TaxID=210409 RepID=A0A5B7CWT0_PORTR|nr:hypothetical protein [Portunus trituberculatus]
MYHLKTEPRRDTGRVKVEVRGVAARCSRRLVAAGKGHGQHRAFIYPPPDTDSCSTSPSSSSLSLPSIFPLNHQEIMESHKTK